MANPYLVDVFDTGNDLLRETASLIFLQSLSLNNIVEKFSATGVLHYQK